MKKEDTNIIQKRDFISGWVRNKKTIGGTTLDCIIWLLVDTHYSATFGFGLNHIKV